MLVRFTRRAFVAYQPAQAGDVRELPDATARQLIDSGVCVAADTPAPIEEAVAPAAVETAEAPEQPRRRGRR